MDALDVSAHELDIRPAAMQILRDLGHPAADVAAVYDVVYENVQAAERTSHLFRLANFHGGVVLGTGDPSELALGWATYGVGDQMSHYDVNASVPKTLIQFLVRWAIDTDQFGREVDEVLAVVLETQISPELLPRQDTDSDRPGADSESVVGPYERQDFFLCYVLRFGCSPSKVAYLAAHAWGDLRQSTWPDLIPDDRRNQYTLREIKHWLERVPRAFLPHQPVQALGDAERAESRLGFAVTAGRLARPQRRDRQHLAGRAARASARPRVALGAGASACCGQNRAGAGRGAEAQVRERDDLYSSATPVLRGTVRRASERPPGHLPVWRLYVAQSRR